jgi:DNA-binding transcriptional regulator of glucitol operon
MMKKVGLVVRIGVFRIIGIGGILQMKRFSQAPYGSLQDLTFVQVRFLLTQK